MQRKRVPKFQNSVKLSNTKDNTTYISMFPLERSQAYLNHNRQLTTTPTSAQLLSYKDDEIIDNFRTMLQKQTVPKHEINKYFSSVTTKKLGQNKFQNSMVNNNMRFLEEYRLENGELMQVCENKTFVLKNYFNYLHDNQMQKAVNKIEQRNKHLQAELNRFRIQQSQIQMMKDQSHLMISRSKQQEQVLDPKHVKFQQPIINFNPKQRERIEMSKRALFQSNYRWRNY